MTLSAHHSVLQTALYKLSQIRHLASFPSSPVQCFISLLSSDLILHVRGIWHHPPGCGHNLRSYSPHQVQTSAFGNHNPSNPLPSFPTWKAPPLQHPSILQEPQSFCLRSPHAISAKGNSPPPVGASMLPTLSNHHSLLSMPKTPTLYFFLGPYVFYLLEQSSVYLPSLLNQL